MTFALVVCTLWLCAPVPLVTGLASRTRCRAKAVELAVPGVHYHCREIGSDD